MRSPLPGELGERDLGLRAVGEAHQHELLQDLDAPDPALHAAAPAAVGLARRPDPREAAPELLVLRELVEQAALEPPAVAEEPAVVERDVLRLGHLHRDRIEPPEGARAAELPPARTDPVLHPGHVAGPDLPHLDARVELPGELAHQLAEVDPAL